MLRIKRFFLSTSLILAVMLPPCEPVFAYDPKASQIKTTAGDTVQDELDSLNSSAAAAAPKNAKYIVQTLDSTLTNEQDLASLSTGILKNTTTTGVLSVASAGTDYVAPNAGITGATKTKVTYDSKGLVTAGADATTSDIGEGSNLYYTDARARAAISETITGLDYSSSTGVLSLTSGYVIPTTTEESHWNTAYGWGNHALAGYLTSYTESDPIVKAISGIIKSNGSTISAASAGTDYVAPNAAIIGATKTKITYDLKGLVTGGADATTADIADSMNKRYVTDAQLTVLGNTSGTNTGDQDLSGYVPTSRTVNGHALSANVTVTASDVGLGNVTNNAQYYAGGTDVALADGGTGASLSDPGANRLMGWDDTDNATNFIAIGSNLSYDHASHTLSAAGAGSPTWGGIGGTLSNQTDLQTALDGKVNGNVAITGATKTKITYDSKGLVTAGADATTSDIAEGSNLYYTDARVRLNQLDQMAAPTSDVGMNSHKITNLLDPTSDSDAATKSYVDAVASGLSPKTSCRLATAAVLPTVVYSNGASGVGATLTAVGTGVLTVDGNTVALNNRILVKNQSTDLQNGIYKCTTAGAVGVAFILTRTTDNDSSSDILGSFTFIEDGTVNASSGFVDTNVSAITMGTDSITWTQFSGAGEITFNSPLSKSGNTVSIADAAADGATKGAASFTASDFDASSGNISIDYTNSQAASHTVKGFLTSADWDTFNGKQGAGNYITALTGDVTAAGPGSVAATITDGAVTLGKMANMTTASILGRNTAGSGSPEVLSASTTKSILSLNNVENTALSTWVGSANLTTLGTITTGAWSGTAIGVSKGGTGATSASGGFDALSPMTTLGDTIYGGASGTGTRLAGNTTTTRKFLRQNGDGAASAAPAWDTVTKTDVGLASVENTALSTWAGTSNITTLGTIGAGTWNATSIGTAYTDAKVTSITGTSNQVNVSASTGAITLSTPQSIATTSAVQFGKQVLGTKTGGSYAGTFPLSFLTHAAGSENTTAGLLSEMHLQTGGLEDATNCYFLHGFGYVDSASTYSPSYIGYKRTTGAGQTKGDLVFGTRAVTTDTAPSERMRITSGGLLGLGSTAPISSFDIAKAAAPTTITVANCYEHLGGGEYATNSYRLIGFGFNSATTYPKAYMGYQELAIDGTSGHGDLVFGTAADSNDTAPTERMRLTYNGLVGIGLTPVGVLHLKAGGATSPQLRMAASTAPNAATMATGDIWNDSTQEAPIFSLKNPSGEGQYAVIGGTMFVSTADATVANTTTETSLIGTGLGIRNLENVLIAGKTIRVKAAGYYSNTGTPKLQLNLKIGGTYVCQTVETATASSVTNKSWSMEATITCRTTGTSGTVYAQGNAFISDTGSSAAIWPMVKTATTTINTTSQNLIGLASTWDAASASNTITCTNFVVEILN